MTMRRRPPLTARVLEHRPPHVVALLPSASRAAGRTLRAWGLGALMVVVLAGVLGAILHEPHTPGVVGQSVAGLEQAWWLVFGAAFAVHLLVLGTVGVGMLRRR